MKNWKQISSDDNSIFLLHYLARRMPERFSDAESAFIRSLVKVSSDRWSQKQRAWLTRILDRELYSKESLALSENISA